LVEQLIRNQQVTSSSLVAGSKIAQKTSRFDEDDHRDRQLTHYPRIVSIWRAAFAAVCC
jgi:hypothetical protein